jgi:hypothetical protein
MWRGFLTREMVSIEEELADLMSAVQAVSTNLPREIRNDNETRNKKRLWLRKAWDRVREGSGVVPASAGAPCRIGLCL